MSIAKKPINYIDNTVFTNMMERYIESRENAKFDGRPPPPVPDEIALTLLQIATNLATRWNFNRYSWLDDMIGEGILDAIKAVDNFDPAKGKPFSYFTRVIFWAFLRVIKKEKSEREARDAMMFDSGDAFTVQEGDEFNMNKDAMYMLYHGNE